MTINKINSNDDLTSLWGLKNTQTKHGASEGVNLFKKKKQKTEVPVQVCLCQTSVLVFLCQNIVKHSKIKGKGVVKCLQGRMPTFLYWALSGLP